MLGAMSTPLARSLAPCVAAAFALQAGVALPSVAAQSEKLYDASGSATVLAVGALSLWLPRRAGASPSPLLGRQLVATGLAAVWTVRLGTFLAARIRTTGHDARFDTLRTRPAAFFAAFMAQAGWVSAMLAPVVALNAVPAGALGVRAAAGRVLVSDVLGLAVWAAGFALEVVADAQKSRWAEAKRRKLHDEDFMSRGLFAWCRFPNYLGEITLWTGLAIYAAGALAQQPVQRALGLAGGPSGILATTALCCVSPLVSGLLITQVSGIPLSEAKYDARYGSRPDYRRWRENTPRLLPGVW